MQTEILEPVKKNIQLCAAEIKSGGVVAFPTETVYGLGANALDETAVKKIYEAKGRPGDNPLIVHISAADQIYDIAAEIPESALLLVKKFMPGALTIILKKKAIIPDIVSGGRDTVGIRFPSHKVAQEFLHECGVPVCAPSANTSTRPSPTMAMHVYTDLNGKIPYILDGGRCEIGVESTIIDLSEGKPRLLRMGGITIEQIREVIGDIEVVKSSTEALCPGMKYKHYAPKADVLFAAYYDDMFQTICERYDFSVKMGKNPVILCLNQDKEKCGGRNIIYMGGSYDDYAHNLFAALRQADELKFDTIIAEGVAPDGMGNAIINRLVKSSGGQII